MPSFRDSAQIPIRPFEDNRHLNYTFRSDPGSSVINCVPAYPMPGTSALPMQSVSMPVNSLTGHPVSMGRNPVSGNCMLGISMGHNCRACLSEGFGIGHVGYGNQGAFGISEDGASRGGHLSPRYILNHGFRPHLHDGGIRAYGHDGSINEKMICSNGQHSCCTKSIRARKLIRNLKQQLANEHAAFVSEKTAREAMFECLRGLVVRDNNYERPKVKLADDASVKYGVDSTVESLDREITRSSEPKQNETTKDWIRVTKIQNLRDNTCSKSGEYIEPRAVTTEVDSKRSPNKEKLFTLPQNKAEEAARSTIGTRAAQRKIQRLQALRQRLCLVEHQISRWHLRFKAENGGKLPEKVSYFNDVKILSEVRTSRNWRSCS